MTTGTVYGTYFSPVGTTKKVLSAILNSFPNYSEYALNKELAPTVLNANDVLFVALPVFGGRIPSVTIEHIRKLKGNHTPAVAVVVYGNRAYEDALLELSDLLTEQGFVVIGGAAFVAQHSMAPSIAHSRPNQSDLEKAKVFGDELRDKLSKLDNITSENTVAVSGNRPYRTYNGVPFKPKASKSCIKCGICARACPAGAIPMDNPNKTNNDLCITCMHCTAICPQKARGLGKVKEKMIAANLSKACNGDKEPEWIL